ncbi:MAG: hypothetical protein WA840_14255 [Caulobacteraceae bacterium]
MRTGRGEPLLQAAEAMRAMTGSMPEAVAQAFAILGEEAVALRIADVAKRPQAPSEAERQLADAMMQDAHALPALDTLARRVRDRRIVMINEAHHVPRHRAFSAALALRLREEGFNWFLAEAFAPAISRLTPNTPVKRGMGTYINDPVFAEGLRRLRDAGYRFAAYDYPDSNTPLARPDMSTEMNGREASAAWHIKALLDREPQARIIVHVGFGHIGKHPTVVDGKPLTLLGERLQEVTGVTPFCIDQTYCSPHSEPGLDYIYLQKTIARFQPTEPVLLRLTGGAPLGVAAYMNDETVLHPRFEDAFGRPGWRSRLEGVKPIRVDLKLAQARRCVMLHALSRAEAGSEAVPSDTLVIQPEMGEAYLMLRPGAYTLQGETREGVVDLGSLNA